MNRYLTELARQLPEYNCSTAYDENDNHLRVINDGTEICSAYGNGDIFCRPEYDHTYEQHELYFTIQGLAQQTSEYVTAVEKASPLSADGLREGYRKINEYNGIVLAARDMNDHGFEFVTWRRSYNGTAVGNGNHFMDYSAAKQDFAIRSGLVNGKSLLSDEQLENAYRALEFTKNNNDCLTYDQEKDIQTLMDHIKNLLPYVEEMLRDDTHQSPQLNM